MAVYVNNIISDILGCTLRLQQTLGCLTTQLPYLVITEICAIIRLKPTLFIFITNIIITDCEGVATTGWALIKEGNLLEPYVTISAKTDHVRTW